MILLKNLRMHVDMLREQYVELFFSSKMGWTKALMTKYECWMLLSNHDDNEALFSVQSTTFNAVKFVSIDNAN